MNTIKLKPGILVSLRTSMTGGVSYIRTDLSTNDEGDAAITRRAVERWETTKVTEDPDEHERAGKVRSNAATIIRKLCINSAFGLLCPLEREKELGEAIERAKTLADEFNATSNFSRVSVYVLRGHIATTDEEAAEAIGEEVRSLVESMNAGIGKLDVEAIREAASKAAQLAEMLSPEQEELVTEAVKAARSAARQIVSRVQKEGEDAAVVLADLKRGAIERARMAFLDFTEPTEIAADVPRAPAANAARMGAIEIPAVEEVQ